MKLGTYDECTGAVWTRNSDQAKEGTFRFIPEINWAIFAGKAHGFGKSNASCNGFESARPLEGLCDELKDHC